MPDWWLWPPLSAPPCPALPHLEALQVEVAVMPLKEATLAVLLDAAPHLRELTLRGFPLSNDDLPLAGARCPQLRSLLCADRVAGKLPRLPLPPHTQRWTPLPASSALPHLTSLLFYCLLLYLDHPDTRRASFASLASYLVHSPPPSATSACPATAGCRRSPSVLPPGQLPHLRGLSFQCDEWMQKGPLRRYWKPFTTGTEAPKVDRGAGEEDADVWGEEESPLPRPQWPWREERRGVAERMSAGARREVELWRSWSSSCPPSWRNWTE